MDGWILLSLSLLVCVCVCVCQLSSELSGIMERVGQVTQIAPTHVLADLEVRKGYSDATGRWLRQPAKAAGLIRALIDLFILGHLVRRAADGGRST